jgi:hypothetical protein
MLARWVTRSLSAVRIGSSWARCSRFLHRGDAALDRVEATGVSRSLSMRPASNPTSTT